MKRAREGQSAEDVMKLFKRLSAAEQARFVRLLKGGGSGSDDMEEYLTEQRFSGGRVCPICGSIHVCRNGKRENGTQVRVQGLRQVVLNQEEHGFQRHA